MNGDMHERYFHQQERRNRNLCVRLTDAEMGFLEAMAADHDITVAQFVRKALANQTRAGERDEEKVSA
jgi:hypothetical protein